jgi:DNA mismatch endonuclease (patch repair protein)
MSEHSWTIYTTTLRAMTTAKRIDPVTPNTSRRMSATKGRDNQPELSLRSALHRRGLRFRVHVGVLQGSRRSVDIAFPRQRIAIFVDGCFWHGCPSHGTWPKNNAQWWREKIEANRLRDRDTDRRLTNLGWIVIRVWEHEEVLATVERVAAALLRGQALSEDPATISRQHGTPGLFL